jgi:hypothetical protein
MAQSLAYLAVNRLEISSCKFIANQSSTLAVYVPDVEYNLALACHERDRLDEAGR